MTVGNNPKDRSKLGIKREFNRWARNSPVYNYIFSCQHSNYIKLVTDVVDNVVIRRPLYKYGYGRKRIRRQGIYVLIKDTILNAKNRN